MGWTSYHANYYKNTKTGRTVDRKAECDAYWEEGLNRGHFKVLKSAMVGSVYYAAVQPLLTCTGKTEDGQDIYTTLEENERETFGVVFLTSVDMKDYYNFSYKDMDETCGPYQCECPKRILDLLSPTANEYALDWRSRCYENIEAKKNPKSFANLPIGTKIEVTMPFNTSRHNEGDKVILEKYKKWNGNRTCWQTNRGIIFVPHLMKMIEAEKDCYVILN